MEKSSNTIQNQVVPNYLFTSAIASLLISALVVRSAYQSFATSSSLTDCFKIFGLQQLLLTVLFQVGKVEGSYSTQLDFEQKFNNLACSCLQPYMQRVFCQADFVFLGKFYADTDNEVYHEFLPKYRFRNYKVKVLRYIKGDFRQFGKRRTVDINIPYGNCAPDHLDKVLNRTHSRGRKKIAIMMGYRFNGHNFVSKCGVLTHIHDLTEVQSVGLFLGKYKRGCHVPNCYSEIQENHIPWSEESATQCPMNTMFMNCYDKYAQCKVDKFTGQCYLSYKSLWPRSKNTKKVYRRFLQHSNSEWLRNSETDYYERFRTCVSWSIDKK